MLPIDVQAMCIDLLAFPGHKSLLGPTGTGALYVGNRATLRPWREGGTGGDSLTPTQPPDFPHHLEGGTPNVLGVAGLVAGLNFVEERGVGGDPRARGRTVRPAAERARGVARLRGVRPRGREPARRHDQLPVRGAAGPRTRGAARSVVRHRGATGASLRPYIHKALGTAPDGLVRVSPGPFNTEADIDHLIDALKQITGGM